MAETVLPDEARSGRVLASHGMAMLCAAAFLSGAAALVYEVTWVRKLGTLLGNTTYAVNVVLAVFFAGLGVGAWTFGRIVDRARPTLLLFGLLEASIAVSGLLFWPLSGVLDALYVALAPAEWPLGRSVACHALVTALLLFVPAFFMGGTLPALVRYATAARSRFTLDLGLLYGVNTIGGALGAFLTVFVLIPRLGLVGTGIAAACLNVAAILAALASRPRGVPATAAATARVEAAASDGSATGVHARLVLAAAAWSGFLAVGLEVLWTRALAMRFMSTVYSFATILVVFLVCLGLGSLIVKWLVRRELLGGVAVAVVMTSAGIAGLASVILLTRLSAQSVGASGAAGAVGIAALQVREFVQTLIVVALPTLLFGLNFPVLCHLVHRRGFGTGRSVGAVFLANTVGSVAAPLVFGFALVPAWGLRTSLLAVSWGGVAFGLLFLWVAPIGLRVGTRAAASAASVLVAAVFTYAAGGEVGLWQERPGDTLLYYRDGVSASVAVVESAEGGRVLKVDNTYHLGGTQQGFAQARQGLIPLLLHDRPARALFIGLATGTSAGQAAAYGGVATDILEIVPGLQAILPWFADVNANLADRILGDEHVRLLEVDGRQFVRTTRATYDVVVGDLFVPWRAGEGSMYAREHLAAVRDVLSDGGLFCQWLPLYQLRADELRTIVATFCEVFPSVAAVWLYLNVEQPVIGLVCSVEPISIDPERLRERLAAPARAALLERAGLTDVRTLLGSWIAGKEALTDWAAGAPLETHDRPRVEFAAPYSRFRGSALPAAENVPLLVDLTRPVSGAAFWGDAPAHERVEAERYQRSIGLFFRARHALVHAGDAPEAIRRLQAAMRETPEWDWIAWNLERIAQRALQTGAHDIALAAAQALGENPQFRFFGLYYAALVNLQRNELAAARLLAERARALDPEHAGCRALLDELARRE